MRIYHTSLSLADGLLTIVRFPFCHPPLSFVLRSCFAGKSAAPLLKGSGYLPTYHSTCPARYSKTSCDDSSSRTHAHLFSAVGSQRTGLETPHDQKSQSRAKPQDLDMPREETAGVGGDG